MTLMRKGNPYPSLMRKGNPYPFQEAQALKLPEELRIDRRLGVEFEVLESLVVRQARELEICLDSTIMPGTQLEIEQALERFEESMLLDSCRLQHVVERFESRAHSHLLEAVADTLVAQPGLHVATS